MRSLNIDGVDQPKKKKEPGGVSMSSKLLDIVSIDEINESFMFLSNQFRHDHSNKNPYKKARELMLLFRDLITEHPELPVPQKWVDEISGTWYLYLLRCNNGQHYIGITTNIEKRLREHNQGKASRFTRAKSRLPVVLVATRGPYTESSAKRLEYSVKRRYWKLKMKFFGVNPDDERKACWDLEDKIIKERVRREHGC